MRKALEKVEIKGERFLADRLHDVRWLRGVKAVIRVRKGAVGREDVNKGGIQGKERDRGAILGI